MKSINHKKTKPFVLKNQISPCSLCVSAVMKTLKIVQNSENIEHWKKELLDVMQAWHGLSKYNSATAVSISFYAQSISKKYLKIKK
jgi:hypothetical protein